jgi:hypothetical protein
MMVKVVDSVPSDAVCTSPPAEIPLQLTGTDWLIGAGRLTVGWFLSLLHSRMAPADLASKPDPVMVTLVPPFKQVPGLAVMLGGPVEVVDFAVQGTVVVVVVGWVVVVVELVVVVVVELVVVVVVVPPPPPEKLMAWVTWSPPWSPKAMTQESPAVTWADVGGHG